MFKNRSNYNINGYYEGQNLSKFKKYLIDFLKDGRQDLNLRPWSQTRCYQAALRPEFYLYIIKCYRYQTKNITP